MCFQPRPVWAVLTSVSLYIQKPKWETLWDKTGSLLVFTNAIDAGNMLFSEETHTLFSLFTGGRGDETVNHVFRAPFPSLYFPLLCTSYNICPPTLPLPISRVGYLIPPFSGEEISVSSNPSSFRFSTLQLLPFCRLC